MLSVVYPKSKVFYSYADCHSVECSLSYIYVFIVMLIVAILSAIHLKCLIFIVMLIVRILSVVYT
jgi:hypothetical protein